jgi:hypothetical protein
MEAISNGYVNLVIMNHGLSAARDLGFDWGQTGRPITVTALPSPRESRVVMGPGEPAAPY